MENISALLGLFGMFAVIAGAIMLTVKSLAARKPLGKKLAIGGAVAFVTGSVIMPDRPKANAKVEPAPIVTPSATPSAEAIVAPDKASSEGERAFLALYRDVLARAAPCDKAVTQLGKTAQGGDPYATYQVAKNGNASCQTAADAMYAMEVPDGLPEAANEELDKALKACRFAYAQRASGLAKAMEIADGNGRPSTLSEMTEMLKDGQTGTLMCVAGFFATASKSGIASKRLA